MLLGPLPCFGRRKITDKRERGREGKRERGAKRVHYLLVVGWTTQYAAVQTFSITVVARSVQCGLPLFGFWLAHQTYPVEVTRK